jgi:hypothetical protein
MRFVAAFALLLLPLLALAQDGTPPADADLWLPGPLDGAKALGAMLAVNVAVLFARAIAPVQLAPTPSTVESRRRVHILALVVGLATGVAGLAGFIPYDDTVPGGLWFSRLASGLLVAGVAMFGRDAVVHGWRKRRAGRPESFAGMNTDQMRIERAKDEAPDDGA